jgi:hypothetical protein
MKLFSLTSFCVMLLYSEIALAQGQGEENTNNVRAAQLRCFIQNYDTYRALADATRFVVVDFETCPVLPDGDDILQAVLAAMGSDMSNSLGAVTFAGEGERSQFKVFTVDEADCIRNWVYKISSPDDALVDLARSFCFDE